MKALFDAAFVIVLVVCAIRSARCRFALGIVAPVVCIALVVAVGWSALDSGAGVGGIELPMGLVAMGPSAILHERSGPLAFLASPWMMGIASLLLTAGPSWAAHRRALPMHPDTPPAMSLARVETLFVLAATFVAIRLVTLVMFHLIATDSGV